MAATLSVAIIADATKARKVLGDTGDDLDKFSNRADKASGDFGASMANVGKAVLAVGAVAAVGFAAVATSAWSAAEESMKIGRETERVIKTTGGAANVTADQVGDMSSALSDVQGVDDEVIQGVANLLLTFTNVKNVVGDGNDVFTQATGLASDMAAVLGTDASGAAIQLGKALNDPMKGISALSKAGVSFTQDQKDQIKVLQEAGDTLGAQKIILGELSKEFGGAAAAAATPLDRLKVQVGNFQEAVGAWLIPVVASAAEWIGVHLPIAFERASTFVTGTVVPALAALQLWAQTNEVAVRLLAVGVGLLALAVWAVAAPVSLVVAGLAVLAAGVAWAYTNSEVFRGAVDALWAALNDLWANVLQPLASFLHGALSTAFAVVVAVVTQLYERAIRPLFEFVAANREVFEVLAKVLGVVVLVAVVALVAALAFCAATFAVVVAVVATVVVALLAVTVACWRVVQFFWDLAKNVQSAIADAARWVGDKVGEIVGFFVGMPGRIGAVTSGLFDGIKDAFRSAINFVIRGWNDLNLSLPGVDVPGIGKIGGFTLDTPNIPLLAAGGIVTRPTLLVAGEGGESEAIIPLSALADLRGGNTYNVTVQTTGLGSDSPQVARDVVRAIRNYEARNGRLYR